MNVSKVYRIIRLITLLQGRRGYTAAELARELEVSRRTIFRDLNMLEMAHIPYYFDNQSGGYSISKHFFLPPLNFTLSESLVLLLLTRRLSGADKLPLLSEGARAATKIESTLPASIRDEVGDIISGLHVNFGAFAKHENLDETFDLLAGAIAKKKTCRILYKSLYEQEQIKTTLHPYRMVFQGRAWYLLAHSSMHNQQRTFKLSRIAKLTVLDKTFRRPKDADSKNPKKHFGDAWSMIPEGKVYNVHLHFEPMVASNVAEVQWHHSQQVTGNDDGSIEFRVQVDGLREISWWILGYGDQVEVISPAPLRKKLAASANALAAKYRKVDS